MKKIVLFSMLLTFLIGCNMNADKEKEIQKLETELQNALHKVNALEKGNSAKQINIKAKKGGNMNLGAFSVSLSVKDINLSKVFYERLGFVKLGGDLNNNYLIMKNENSVIGLFQNMFEGNILTFNPGWDENGKETNTFIDVRKIQQELKNKGINVGDEIEQNTSGPANFMMTDPDGNVILIDQHR